MTNETKTNSVPQERKQKRSDKTKETSIRWMSFRLFPIWLRLVFILLLLFIAACAGLMIGYGVIGDGEPLDALKWKTWQHILDIVNGKE
ncbi:DNA-directed RNA polymerase subunit beta [Lysinibacillus telephonicus]|uniref:DNA-directed RNA polymerase subunit beta n=1 Tax=Lysinibacillus telephonicus TaxID=1714840 RepID=A0A3S0JRZ7_9BACI|nr:DNA-directed RNA polymerase subunit beta [Lysinibacillus telephonicus]RTQ89826.1 DNA-directed RNA polymerase subunit beta [Lysinibacillus telephonicus]